MARTFKLTWQQGAAGRAGRWRKKYKGKAYYFPGGRGKSDREAYAAALAAWEAKKQEIDGTAVNSLQLDYEEAIEKWEDVLRWSRNHDDQSMAEEATDYLEKLRLRQEAVRLKPLTHYDRFEGRFALPREVLDQIMSCIPSGPLSEETKVEFAESLSRTMRSSGPFNFRGVSEEAFADPLRTEKAIWEDRLKTQRRSALPSDTSVYHLIETFVAEKDAEANAGALSAGRSYKVHLQLQDFAQWIGESTDVTEITSRLLIGYKQHLLEKVSEGVWKQSTASGRMKTVRAFIRWLWRTEFSQESTTRGGGFGISPRGA